MVNTNTFLENRWSRPSSSACGHSNMWHQSKNLRRPLRKRLHYDFIQRQLKREKEAKLGKCITQITYDCKDMLRKKLEEIELYNSTISQNRNRKQKCYKCRQRGHIIKNCPMKEKEHGEGTKMAGNTSILMKGQESAKLMNKELMTTKATISLNLGGYLSVYFARDFGKIGEILGLSIQDGEEVRRCYTNFLDVFTSYYKTARVPKQEHNPILGMPTKIMKEGKEYTCLASHQCDFPEIEAPNMEAASRRGKEKIEHFKVLLEDIRRESDSHHFQPIQPNIKRSQTMNKDIQGMTKRPTNLDKEDTNKEDTNNSSSDDFTIIT
uniref:ARID DNA-binding domain-containing protein n=1 Tax=Tanacetum cinerariifolium TaxID=118510 RepID=A0A699I5G9_TANCI|nr:ARID DNA-binding domain-containing protein [Tanacetum cinerariifolium]